MAIGDIYIRFKSENKTRREMCCLAKYLFSNIEEYRISSEDDEKVVPSGFYRLERINPKPEIPEGMQKGYRFRIEDGVMKRWYLVCEGPDDPQLLVVEDYEDAVQDFLDRTVQQKGYDNVYTCLSYKGDPDPIFAAEAEAVLSWRSQVWRTAQGILNQWATGQIPQPTIQDVIRQLPSLVWPDVQI